MPTGGVGWSWLIPANSKQPELAMKWIDFILSDEVMKRRAEDPASTMLYPREIEEVLLTHPDVSLAAVIGKINRLFAGIGVERMPQVILDDIGAL